MKLLRAKSAGFCMGVSRALRHLDDALQVPDVKLVLLGPIIHNTQVIDEYAAQGVITLDTVDAVLEMQKCTVFPLHVVIRAHGIPVQDEECLRLGGVISVDATCPRVKEAQISIAEATKQGLPLALFGEPTHPEVLGLRSYAQGMCHVFESFEAARGLAEQIQGPIVLAAQTTQEARQFERIAAMFKEHIEDVIVLATICHATGRRQMEAISLAKQVDAMIIVGGKSSGNTRRLADVALSHEIPAWHVENLRELLENTDFLEKKEKFSIMGLTAGASTPKSLIDELATYLINEKSY